MTVYKSRSLRWFALILITIATTIWGPMCTAGVVTMNSGVVLEGRMGKIHSLADDPWNPQGGGAVKVKQIVILDDGLTRRYVSSKLRSVAENDRVAPQVINIHQRVQESGRRIAGVGPLMRVQPFDKFGRRIITMNMPAGPIDVVQGITEITPKYVKVEGLLGKYGYIWDMRLATSSIPRSTLSGILMQQVDQNDPDARLQIVRLYIQAERFRDARMELEAAIKDFPELADLKRQVQELYQMGAKRIIDEIKLRKDVGQHVLAASMAEDFPTDGVAGQTILAVRDILGEYERLKGQRDRVLELLELHNSQLENVQLQGQIKPILAEIKDELNITTLNRMADYARLADDKEMKIDQKLALAISGWLHGNGAGTQNLAVAISLYNVRNSIRSYLRATHVGERKQVLQKLQAMEGSDAESVAKLIKFMKPAIETKVPAPVEGKPTVNGYYELTAPGLDGQPDVGYCVQLPPNYDPYRKYPVVVTLNGAGSTPQRQIDWWCGSYYEKPDMRLGQSTRNGYIVIAPKWSIPFQKKYNYSLKETAAVLLSLRDASRRFAIDSNRVFLSGHSMGGDLAWDVGLSHPDLWAGVIPIVPTADKYIKRYWENGRGLPMYFVCGQLDGNKMSINGPEWDRYLTKVGYDCLVVEYLGRGHEHFQDEVHQIFDWMDKHNRDFFLKEYKCLTMRPWDNFFWWAELDNFPQRGMVLPELWPPPPRTLPVSTEGRILNNNKISLRTGADKVTIYLSPEMVDFKQRVGISLNSRSKSLDVKPDTEVILEDVRTRADYIHPFWAKVEF